MRVSDSNYYTLRRLHSLTGVVPIGAFLLEHFYTNSQAVRGAAAFNHAAAEIAGIPYVQVLEVLGIGLPILFHMVLGVLIATTMQANLPHYRHGRNLSYWMQRVTGLFLVLYITFHVWSTRFSPEVLRGDGDLFGLMQRHLQNPAILAFYILGVLAACYHFGNGLFGFAVHWGIATGRRAQRHAARLAMAVFVLLALVGINALLAFVGHDLKWFQRGTDTTAMRAIETAR